MTKKRQANEPIVAEEPVRPTEQFSLDQAESVVAPPSTRKRGDRTRASEMPRFGARSARERRAGRTTPSAERRSNQSQEEYSSETISNLLRHPTRTVTEAQLREEYSYVLTDLRSMAIVSAGLVVLLVLLAQVLPK
jgi:hypothetical protein